MVGLNQAGSRSPESHLALRRRSRMCPFDDAITAYAKALWLEQQCDEIERAFDNVKRSVWDSWFRREWYRAGRGRSCGRRRRP
jgi:hypothetical protein